MRFYEIVVLNADGSQYNISPGQPAKWSSLNANGTFNTGALNVELDIPVFSYDAPAGNVKCTIWGAGLSVQSQSANFNDKTIKIYGGMSKGLPLAKPAQAGLLVTGTIFQAFGNWVGVVQTLDFILNAATGSPDTPVNISFNWPAGTSLSAAIGVTLLTAFPTLKQSINIRDTIAVNNTEPGVYESLDEFNGYINDLSMQIIGGDYTGVHMAVVNGTIQVWDDSYKPAVKNIDFTDLIGQPQWLDLATIQVQCVMRSDIALGTPIMLPQTPTVNNAQSNPRFRSNLVFQGTFDPIKIRHVGNFRQPDAASWVTIIDAVSSNTAVGDQGSA